MPVKDDSKIKEKIDRLHSAYSEFLVAMEELKKERKELDADLGKVLDKQAMHDILQKISNLKDN
jgi:seryl-tRNA synthetase